VTPADITASPAWFPLQVANADGDGDRNGDRPIRLIRLDEATTLAASFLDERMLALRPTEALCTAAMLDAAGSQLPVRAQYIFHIGHVGSTLISRLVGACAPFSSLREPAMLRSYALDTLADDAVALPLRALLALLSRTWRPSQTTVVKATSFVSEIAETLLAQGDNPAAIFVFAQASAYLGGILAGPASRSETLALAPARLRRLRRRLGALNWNSDPASPGEAIAMSWLCEMMTLHRAAARCRPQIMWLDFDAFLAEPVPAFTAILKKLGTTPAHSDVETVLSGPLMHQYSKGPELPYDARLRRDVLHLANLQHGAEIKRGMDWLTRVAILHPPVQALFGPASR